MAVRSQEVALITGANKGIGFETAAQLAAKGRIVYIGARSSDRGEAAVARLRGDGADARFVYLDITDDRSIADAAAHIRSDVGRLDILVNNAGILAEGDFGSGRSEDDVELPLPSSIGLDILHATFAANCFGAVLVTNAMLPLLRAAPLARVVNVSSRLASLRAADAAARGVGDDYLVLLAYNSAKAALNMATLQYAIEFQGSGILINAADPGHCATDINGHLGERSPVEAARVVVHLATLGPEGPSGCFIGDEGIRPW